MGTRVDFYSGRGETAEWLGSYPFDGYPQGVFEGAQELFGESLSDEDWRAFVAWFLAKNGDRSTTPDQGWPWPWENSQTTDYAYACDDGQIYGSCFGHKWFEVNPDDENWGEDEDDASDKSAIFPDMTTAKAVTYGPRSGLIIISGLS